MSRNLSFTKPQRTFAAYKYTRKMKLSIAKTKTSTLLSLLFTDVISKHFEVVEIKEGKDRFDIRMEEFKEFK